MIRSRYAWRLFGAAVFLVLASTHVFAVSPSYVVFYGEGLPNPVVLRMSNDTPSEFLWSYARPFKTVNGVRTPTLPGGLEGRTYLNYAVFWGRWPNGPGRPEDASQHGRFYLPTAKAPAAVVITSPDMDAPPPAEHPSSHPIPATLSGFWGGWVLTTIDLAAAKALGVPRL